MSSYAKVYLVEFKDKQTSEVVFHKFGHTHHFDAMRRFEYPEYDKWDIRVLKSVYGPENDVIVIEETLKALFPKNLYIEEKISGVTEIVLLTQIEINKIIKAMAKLSRQYHEKRNNDEQTEMGGVIQPDGVGDFSSLSLVKPATVANTHYTQ